MLESNYYTPLIEEFYVGFEHEEYVSQVISPQDRVIINGEIYIGPEKLQSKWVKSVLSDYHFDMENILDIYNSKKESDKLRVKYLDKSDIESLGFTLIEGSQSEYINSHGDKIWFGKKDDSGLLWITKIINKVEVKVAQWHVIKNINELRKLLKQLGIE
jgi:hypothetical protein